MSSITMYDTAWNDQFPPSLEAAAAYIDGHVGDQPNYAYIVQHFPQAHHLSISVFGNNADCLDIESGAASVAMAAGWHALQVSNGVLRPVLYASASLMESRLFPALSAAKISRASVRLWSAHYGNGPHICGPATCKLLSIPADGTQWTDKTGHLNADQSLLADDFFAGPATDPPGFLTQAEMETIVDTLPLLTKGSTDTPGHPLSVHRMQLLINGITIWHSLPGEQLVVDGDFGPLTEQALKVVQSAFGIAPDGACGPATWEKLITG